MFYHVLSNENMVIAGFDYDPKIYYPQYKIKKNEPLKVRFFDFPDCFALWGSQ